MHRVYTTNVVNLVNGILYITYIYCQWESKLIHLSNISPIYTALPTNPTSFAICVVRVRVFKAHVALVTANFARHIAELLLAVRAGLGVQHSVTDYFPRLQVLDLSVHQVLLRQNDSY
ncbi:Hypothetical_protein [Hexamita inflata]|uniref:Hypothetical_protein n=1 Tax=Hexamita inflata TaxID=28002 RepID=A0AA86QCQ0_9EUKA|nr:Hypothetical protein HINF_LOCUS699 [Hexamita inflata]CAI9956746.1 Hypothetical protein HINF_LOCUS44391 [Hexamita inflata]